MQHHSLTNGDLTSCVSHVAVCPEQETGGWRLRVCGGRRCVDVFVCVGMGIVGQELSTGLLIHWWTETGGAQSALLSVPLGTCSHKQARPHAPSLQPPVYSECDHGWNRLYYHNPDILTAPDLQRSVPQCQSKTLLRPLKSSEDKSRQKLRQQQLIW